MERDGSPCSGESAISCEMRNLPTAGICCETTSALEAGVLTPDSERRCPAAKS